MIEFKLPSLGADMDEGKLLEWKVKPGDAVRKGDVVAVVDTTKAAVEVETWQEGVVEALLVEPGTTIPVGTVIARFLAPGEKPGAAALAPPPVTKPALAAAAATAAALALTAMADLTATPWANSASGEKPNCDITMKAMKVTPDSSRQALMICTQVVAVMPPKST